MYRYKLTPKQLEKANNDYLAELASENWVIEPQEEDHEALLKDFERGHLFNGISHRDIMRSAEPQLTPDLTHINLNLSIDDEEKTKLLEKRHELFNAFLVSNFGDKAELLYRSYDQTLVNLLKNVLAVPIYESYNYVVHVANEKRKINFYVKNDEIYADIIFSEINIYNQDPEELTRLPGKMNLRWRLTENGFELESMSASNQELLDCVRGNSSYVEDVIAKDDYRKAELEFIKAQSNPELNNKLANKAVDVYLETKRLSRQKDADHKKLTDVLERTTHVLKHPEDKSKANEYANLGKQLQGRRSKFKLLAGAMLIFAGTALTLASIGLGVATFGFSTPLSALGIAGGVAVVGGGAALGVSALVGGAGLGIFGHKKRLSNTAVQFGKAVKKQNTAEMTQGRSPEAQATIDMPIVRH